MRRIVCAGMLSLAVILAGTGYGGEISPLPEPAPFSAGRPGETEDFSLFRARKMVLPVREEPVRLTLGGAATPLAAEAFGRGQVVLTWGDGYTALKWPPAVTLGAGEQGGPPEVGFASVNALKLAFLTYYLPDIVPYDLRMGMIRPTVPVPDPRELRVGIREGQEDADLVVVAVLPEGIKTAAGFDSSLLARLYADAGADLVLVYADQGRPRAEAYRGKTIIYGLGGLSGDNTAKAEPHSSVQVFLDREGVEKVLFLGSPTGEEERDVRVHFSRPPEEYRLAMTRRADLDGDGLEEEFALRDGVIQASLGSGGIWQSPADWWVDDFLLGDANNDGADELSFAVWKSGSFGPHKPFWVTGNDLRVRNHFFIFKLSDGVVKPVWQSSNLDRPNREAYLADIDGDGRNELIAVEGEYGSADARAVGVWRWNGWGFSRVEGEEN